MTGATAAALRLRDRGLMSEGYRADLTIFDPADFKDRATYASPHQYPSGTRTTVLVNGTMWSKMRNTPEPYREWSCGARPAAWSDRGKSSIEDQAAWEGDAKHPAMTRFASGSLLRA